MRFLLLLADTDMTATILDHLKGFAIVPTGMVLLYVHRVIRPELVQVRAFGVYMLALVRAFVLSHGVSAEAIEAQVKPGDAAIPQVPEVGEIIGPLATNAVVQNLMDLTKTTSGNMKLEPHNPAPGA